MVFKIENTQFVINVKSVVKGALIAYLLLKLCKSITKIEQTHYVVIVDKSKKTKKEQKEEKEPKRTRINKKAES